MPGVWVHVYVAETKPRTKKQTLTMTPGSSNQGRLTPTLKQNPPDQIQWTWMKMVNIRLTFFVSAALVYRLQFKKVVFFNARIYARLQSRGWRQEAYIFTHTL